MAVMGLVGAHPAWARTYKPTSWDDETVFTTGSLEGWSDPAITYVKLADNDVLDLSGIKEPNANGVKVFVQDEVATIIGNPDVLFEDLDLYWQTDESQTNTVLNFEDFRYQGYNSSNINTLRINYSGFCELAGYVQSGTNFGFLLTADSVVFRGSEGAKLSIRPGTWSGTRQGDGIVAGSFAFEGGSVVATNGFLVTGELFIEDCNLTVSGSSSRHGIWAHRNWTDYPGCACVGVRVEDSTVVIESDPAVSGGGIYCDYDDKEFYTGSYIEIVDSVVAATAVTDVVNYSSSPAAIGDAERILIDNSTVTADVVQGENDGKSNGIRSAAVGNMFHELTIRNGSDVTATGLWGAGVGAGAVLDEYSVVTNQEEATITIADSKVVASSRLSSGIGGGMVADKCYIPVEKIPPVNITISGGSDVVARSGSGAAIGGGRLGYVSSPIGVGVPLNPIVPGVWDETEAGSGSAEMSLRDVMANDASLLAVDASDEFPEGLASLTIKANDAGEEPVIKCESGVAAVTVPVTANKPMMEYTLNEAPDMTMQVNRALAGGDDSGAGAPSYDLRSGFRSLAFWPVAEGTYTLTYGAGTQPAKLVDASDESKDKFEVKSSTSSGGALNSFNVKPEQQEPAGDKPSQDDFSYVYTTERIVYPADKVDLYEDQSCTKPITLSENIISDYIGTTIYARYKDKTETTDQYVTAVVVPNFENAPKLDSNNVSASQSSITYAGSTEGVEYALMAEGSSEPLQVLSGTGGEITFTGLTEGTSYTLLVHVTAKDDPQGHFRSKNVKIEISTADASDLKQVALDEVQTDYAYTGAETPFYFTVAARQEDVDIDDFTVTYYFQGSPLAAGDLPKDAGTYTVALDRPGDATYAAFSRIYAMRVLPQATLTLPESDAASVVCDGGAVAWNDLGVTGKYGNESATESDFSYTVQALDNDGKPTGTASDALPTDAGTYEVFITLKSKTVGTGQPYSEATGTLRLTIAPKEISLVWDGLVGRVVGDGKGAVGCKIADGALVSGDVVNVELTYSCTHDGDDHLIAGEHKVSASLVGEAAGNYGVAVTDATKSYSVAQSATDVTAASYASTDPAAAETHAFTYGDTVYVRATVSATGTAAGQNSLALEAPVSGEAALYLRTQDGEGGVLDTQLTDPQQVSGTSDDLLFSYNTSGKTISVGNATLVVKYAGSDGMAAAEDTVEFLLAAKPVTASFDAEEGSITKVYDGTIDGPDGLVLTLDGVLDGDAVSVKAESITYNDKNVSGANKVTASELSLSGDNAKFYTLSDASTVSSDAFITALPVELVWSASELVYTGEPLAPTANVANLVDGDACDVTVEVAGEHVAVGNYTATATGLSNANYTLADAENVTHSYAIVQASSAMSASAYLDDQACSSFTYGDVITVKGTVAATEEPANTNSLAAPAAQQVALYVGQTQISDSSDLDADGGFELSYNTADQEVSTGDDIVLAVRFVGDANMADDSCDVTIDLAKAKLAPTLIGTVSKVYDETVAVDGASENTLAIAFDQEQIVGDDAPAATATFAFADATVGKNKQVNATNVALADTWGNWYELTTADAAADCGTITQHVLDSRELTVDVTASAITEGQQLSESELSGTVSWADGTQIEGALSWKDPGQVLEAGEREVTFVFTPSDAGYAPIELTVVVTVEQTYVPTPPVSNPTYDIEIPDSTHGSVEVDPEHPHKGDEVVVTPVPDEGFEVTDVTATDASGDPVEVVDNGDGAWSFTQPGCDVTLTVTFACDGGALCPSQGFTDVDQSLWYHGAVDWALAGGVMNGYEGSANFGPNDVLTREQAAAVLYNYLAEGATGADQTSHADVDQSQWYAEAVNWAVAAGVMNGYEGSDEFGIGDALTREQFCAVIANAVGADVDAADESVLDAFPDADGVSPWARKAVAWAVGAGVINGVELEGGGRALQVSRALNRAEMAAMMMNADASGVLTR